MMKLMDLQLPIIFVAHSTGGLIVKNVGLKMTYGFLV